MNLPHIHYKYKVVNNTISSASTFLCYLFDFGYVASNFSLLCFRIIDINVSTVKMTRNILQLFLKWSQEPIGMQRPAFDNHTEENYTRKTNPSMINPLIGKFSIICN